MTQHLISTFAQLLKPSFYFYSSRCVGNSPLVGPLISVYSSSLFCHCCTFPVPTSSAATHWTLTSFYNSLTIVNCGMKKDVIQVRNEYSPQPSYLCNCFRMTTRYPASIRRGRSRRTGTPSAKCL
jgi:hypothetical protein